MTLADRIARRVSSSRSLRPVSPDEAAGAVPRIAACASCQASLPQGWRFCRRCGAEQPLMESIPLDEPGGPRGRPRRCERCQASLATASRFCHDCGLEQAWSRAQVSWPRRIRLPSREFSAEKTLSRQQAVMLVRGAAVVAVAFIVSPLNILIAAIALATLLYVAAFIYRLRLFWTAFEAPETDFIDDATALAIPDRELPIYTILVPVYREAEVIAGLMTALGKIKYPRKRLDIKILLEEDDIETYQAAAAAKPGRHIELVRIPSDGPRTKPKACNVGLSRARGSLVTIYDAEDRPDPLQLRRAVAAFRTAPPDVACLQAILSYHNAEQNLITKWFTIEYAMWFAHLLPGLVTRGAPVPLGGTSNHFRREILEKVGAWDAYNVTEDADLGIRLHRMGYRTRIVESTTYEEANSDFINWVKQRSRWYKGYMQTWLVHMRHPRRLYRDLGLGGFVSFGLFVGGTPLLALLNPVFWILTIVWFVGHPPLVIALFPAWLYYAGMVCLVLGNFAFLYTAMLTARTAGPPRLVFAAILSPAYWVMMSIAAIKALVQLIAAPSFWEKTIHGLDGPAVLTRPSGTSVDAAV
jgi:glycosyltransferase XagB